MTVLLNFFILISPFNLDILNPIIQFLNEACLLRVEENARQHVDIYSALLCGKRLEGREIKSIFTQVGLIHFMVVSGAHLIFLEQMWNRLPHWRFKNILIFLSLLIYALMAGLHPPVFRALISFMIYRLCSIYNFGWNPYWRVMLSGVIVLILQPRWVTSISLQLSWIGSLGFVTAKYSKFLASFLCYFLILPVISQWTILHPLSIGMNFIFFPLLSVTLFPLSIFSFIFPFLFPFTSFFWSQWIHFLNYIQPLFKTHFHITYLSGVYIWVYIGVLFLISQVLWIFIRRN